MPSLSFPGLQLVFLNQGLHRPNREVQQFGRITGAAVTVARVWNGFVTHVVSSCKMRFEDKAWFMKKSTLD
jgi:hypothetical protein